MTLDLSWLLGGRTKNRGGLEFLKQKICVHILELFSSALPLATVRQQCDTSSHNQNRCSSKTKAVMNVRDFCFNIRSIDRYYLQVCFSFMPVWTLIFTELNSSF